MPQSVCQYKCLRQKLLDVLVAVTFSIICYINSCCLLREGIGWMSLVQFLLLPRLWNRLKESETRYKTPVRSQEPYVYILYIACAFLCDVNCLTSPRTTLWYPQYKWLTVREKKWTTRIVVIRSKAIRDNTMTELSQYTNLHDLESGWNQLRTVKFKGWIRWEYISKHLFTAYYKMRNNAESRRH